MKYFLFLIFLGFGRAVAQNPYVQVLGVAQDGGFPQANCQKECCKAVFDGKTARQFVSCIAVIDPVSKQQWIFDATPDFTQQLHLLNNPVPKNLGIFLTHAHIGHYTGIMYLGREAMGANQVKVYAMPKMKNFIEQNGPWSQLVALRNIDLQPIKEDLVIVLNERVSVQPFRVPHRDEFSETVGYKIFTPNKSLVFIPDIDKWQKWNRSLEELIKSVDYAFLDGTFYKDGEINRPMSEVPHPFVTETMDLLKNLPATEKAKVHFIHFNHTNPVINPKSLENKEVRQKGFKVAFQGEKVEL
ncbi:coenzyme PQQ synthesis protein B [Emticicia aquatilis]|uniref:Coenzyme PQQ synthesis protein B n=1 Tax=Emticicia aquatilis TaxID=1537369 RepID=A0A916YN59_9BACT|nr:MBL fold metallo-hydrolase [Emticicia aquatilis]GGD51922.1 coenzyme PQQ synthesis protein B [Emticicia aquatilis]